MCRYLASLYWASTTITTVGYGDIHPMTSKERGVGICVMVLGLFLAGYVTSSVSTLMSIRNTSANRVAAKRQVGGFAFKACTALLCFHLGALD